MYFMYYLQILTYAGHAFHSFLHIEFKKYRTGQTCTTCKFVLLFKFTPQTNKGKNHWGVLSELRKLAKTSIVDYLGGQHLWD